LESGLGFKAPGFKSKGLYRYRVPLADGSLPGDDLLCLFQLLNNRSLVFCSDLDLSQLAI